MEKIAVSCYVTKDFQVAEAIKTLRTNLTFYGEEVKAIALTSVSMAEGKSTISFQLAVSFAQAGKRVLLLDADLRKSMLASRLRVRGKVQGLTHYLSGAANAADLLRQTDVPGLYIMFAGARIPNAAEALESKSFKKLIPALKESFDYIIVDAPPLGRVIDCAIIAPELDGVLMVIDATNNSYKLERRIKNQLEKTGARVLGAVLNRVDFKDKGGYYGRIYGDYGSYEYD